MASRRAAKEWSSRSTSSNPDDSVRMTVAGLELGHGIIDRYRLFASPLWSAAHRTPGRLWRPNHQVLRGW